jgi:cell division protein FtsW
MSPGRDRSPTSPSKPGRSGARSATGSTRRSPGGTAATRAHADAGEARPGTARTGTGTATRPARRSTGTAPGLRGSPGAAALRRAVDAFSQWLRRPLTSLHLILGVFGLLTLFGLVMVLSASSVESYTADGSTYSVFVKQLMFCAVGLVLFWIGLRIPPQRLRALAAPLLLIGIVALAAVLIPGIGALRGGSRAWFAFGPFSVQPSEFVKVALTLWGAHVLALRRNVIHRWKHALSPVVPVALLIFVLLILQPDLGMTVSMGMVLVALLFFAGAPLRLMAALTGGGLAGAVILGLTAGYRQARITAFLSPSTSDPLGPGYQATQALYSLADGGLFGVGLGQGRAKWSYLPNAHNDFIFAIIGEELGFLGAVAVLALFATLAYTGLRIAGRSADPWLRIVVATSTTWLVAQAAINIGYVVGLLPVTGLQLPLISSGGTSLVVTMFIFGVLANAARHEPEAIAALARGERGARSTGLVTRLLRIPPPRPYRAPTARSQGQWGRVR